MSRDTALRDAVVTSLNAASFSQPVVSVAVLYADLNLTEMGTLRVSVAVNPDFLLTENASRGASQHDIYITIGVQKRLGEVADEKTEVDALRGLTEEFADHLLRIKISGMRCIRIEYEVVYSVENLVQNRQYTSIFNAIFRVIE